MSWRETTHNSRRWYPNLEHIRPDISRDKANLKSDLSKNDVHNGI